MQFPGMNGTNQPDGIMCGIQRDQMSREVKDAFALLSNLHYASEVVCSILICGNRLPLTIGLSII
jgi:hypothetical protein